MGDEIEIIPPEARHQVPRVLEALATVPWAITDEALETIKAIASRENEVSIEALEAYRARRVAGTDGLQERGGVGIIRVQGPMFRYASFFTAFSGGATYDGIAGDLTTAIQSPTIRSVLFHWDTPGGEVNGCAELAAMIRSYAAIKPIESYVGGQCCSAGYWLASATSKITIDRTAMLGSIGVRLGIRDSSERDAKSGVKNIEFISSRAPNKRTEWSSDEGKARIQRTADQLEAVFIADVAANRGKTEEEVVSKFGMGGVEIGTDAVSAGMADALGSFEGTLSRLAAGNGRITNGRTSAMATEPAPVYTHTQAQVDQARADGKAEGIKQGATDAQARFAAIINSPEGQANRKLADHFAFATDLTAEAAIASLKAAGPAAAPAAETTTTTTPPAQQPAPTGERARDQVSGLALSTVTDRTQEQQGKPNADAPAISANGIYAKRAEQAKAR